MTSLGARGSLTVHGRQKSLLPPQQIGLWPD